MYLSYHILTDISCDTCHFSNTYSGSTVGSDPSMCTTPCTGDSTQICGGSGSWKDDFMLGKKDCVTPGTIDKYSEHLICIKGNSRKIRNSIESLTEYCFLFYLSGLNISELYLRCYIDSADRDINDAETKSELMLTTIRCLAFCQGLEYTIAATQVAPK